MKNFIWALALCFAFAGSANADLIVGYNTVNGTSVTGTSLDASATAIDLTRGSGLSQASGGDFNSNGWNDSTDAASAATNGDFLQWGVTIDSGFVVSDLFTGFDGDRSGTGPTSIEVFYSTDGFATQTQVLGATDVGSGGSIQNSSSVAGPLSGTVEFRLYGYGASGSTGTFDFEDTDYDGTYGLVIDGTISAIPEPTTAVLFGLAGLGLCVVRRRS